MTDGDRYVLITHEEYDERRPILRFNEDEWKTFAKYADQTDNLMRDRKAEGAIIRRSRKRPSHEG